MVTEKGVLGVLSEKFTSKSEFLSVDKVENIKKPDLTTNYFKKMCATCCVNQLQTIFKNKEMIKCGGCVDCHVVKKRKPALNIDNFNTIFKLSKVPQWIQ